ncbi:MAG: cellulase family glycosylhydrolase [Chloroflexi bacterium]|nr:cellulase family glycosylhydrolase [Chloroflexota bacterium]
MRRRWFRLVALGVFVAMAIAGSVHFLAGRDDRSWPADGRFPVDALSDELTRLVPAGLPGDCRRDPAQVPPPPSPDGRTANDLHTCGSRIYDASGQEVLLTGVNWFGLETGTYAPHGLWARNWRTVLDQIAGLGYNTIRLPFSNEALDPGRQVNGINFALNPDLQGLSSLQVLDLLIAGARERGLRVVLDRHRPTAAGQSALWYTDEVPEERWIADWRMLAARYRGNDTVVGFDLHNEPRGEATWGTGDPRTDWRLAAERAGNAVLEVNPHLLIFVEGVERHQGDWFWWGGELRGVREAPVRLAVPNRVVYSPHDYGPSVYEQGWFQDREFPANLPDVWTRRWGYLAREGIAPVVVGEFGGRSVGDDRDGQWQRTLLAYLRKRGIGYLAWSLNPNSGDTGGILADDWQRVVQEKQEVYRQGLAGPIGLGAGGTFGRAPSRLAVRFRQLETATTSNTISFAFEIVNDGPDPLDLHRLEMRYWYTAGDLKGRTQIASVDWAAIGDGQVKLVLVATTQGRQDHYLRVRFGEGVIEPYQTSGKVQVRFHRSDWSNYQQDNDYSFAGELPRDGQLVAWNRVTLYLDGRLVSGQEPPGAATDGETG